MITQAQSDCQLAALLEAGLSDEALRFHRELTQHTQDPARRLAALGKNAQLIPAIRARESFDALMRELLT